MSELDLFRGPDDAGASFEDGPDAPLAARMRPRDLDEFVGQEHILGPGKALRELIERDELSSLVLWGPPGSGKTTLARIVAARTEAVFERFSAVTEGVKRVREIIGQAKARLRADGPRTILFCDEIHRFNRAQQDAFLPHVEAGTIVLIGATTENPAFEVNRALLSRSRVFVLQPLAPQELERVVRAALEDAERGLATVDLDIDDAALRLLARSSDGDARRALNGLEAAALLVGDGGRITPDAVEEALQQRFAHYHKSGEEHFNLLSAYHKSLRGSDPQGALYWMARMIEGGEDPMTLFRRAIAMAAEDIGMADPDALRMAVAAREAFHVLGPPEGYLPLAEMTVYLATAPKSNASYVALKKARAAARETPAAPVPLHLRNAPTALHRELGYHEGYRYAHDSADGYLPQEYLPEAVRGRVFYEPGRLGFEREVAKRIEWWARLRRESGRAAPDADEAPRTGADDASQDRTDAASRNRADDAPRDRAGDAS